MSQPIKSRAGNAITVGGRTHIVRVSQRRTPRLELMDGSDLSSVDVVMIDTLDAAAMAWARQQTGLASKVVIWVDSSTPFAGHTLLARPVQWPMLPMLLARALENGPRQATKAPKTLETKTPGMPRHEQAKPILLVDDSLTVRNYVRSLLHSFGFAVTEVDNAEDALASLPLTNYACVLMAVMMPGMGGYEACRRIKALARTGNSVPVVMLTSKISPFDRIQGKMAGCDAYLNKPVNPNELLATLSRHVLPVASNRVIQRPVYHNTPGHQFAPS